MIDPAPMQPTATGASFSVANRLARVGFAACWLVFARFTPPPLHRWRAFLLRLFGARIGRGARIYGSARIWLPANLELGEGAIIGPGALLYNQGRITIGAHAVVSQRASLCASTHGLDGPAFPLLLRPIAIGEGCWIASEAFVGPGVTMAAGAVLGARGALFEDAREMGVYRGNPAIWVKERKLDR